MSRYQSSFLSTLTTRFMFQLPRYTAFNNSNTQTTAHVLKHCMIKLLGFLAFSSTTRPRQTYTHTHTHMHKRATCYYAFQKTRNRTRVCMSVLKTISSVQSHSHSRRIGQCRICYVHHIHCGMPSCADDNLKPKTWTCTDAHSCSLSV